MTDVPSSVIEAVLILNDKNSWPIIGKFDTILFASNRVIVPDMVGENMFSKRLIETVKPFSGMILPDEANNLTLSKVYSPAYCIPLAIR